MVAIGRVSIRAPDESNVLYTCSLLYNPPYNLHIIIEDKIIIQSLGPAGSRGQGGQNHGKVGRWSPNRTFRIVWKEVRRCTGGLGNPLVDLRPAEPHRALLLDKRGALAQVRLQLRLLCSPPPNVHGHSLADIIVATPDVVHFLHAHCLCPEALVGLATRWRDGSGACTAGAEQGAGEREARLRSTEAPMAYIGLAVRHHALQA